MEKDARTHLKKEKNVAKFRHLRTTWVTLWRYWWGQEEEEDEKEEEDEDEKEEEEEEEEEEE